MELLKPNSVKSERERTKPKNVFYETNAVIVPWISYSEKPTAEKPRQQNNNVTL